MSKDSPASNDVEDTMSEALNHDTSEELARIIGAASLISNCSEDFKQPTTAISGKPDMSGDLAKQSVAENWTANISAEAERAIVSNIS